MHNNKLPARSITNVISRPRRKFIVMHHKIHLKTTVFLLHDRQTKGKFISFTLMQFCLQNKTKRMQFTRKACGLPMVWLRGISIRRLPFLTFVFPRDRPWKRTAQGALWFKWWPKQSMKDYLSSSFYVTITTGGYCINMCTNPPTLLSGLRNSEIL